MTEFLKNNPISLRHCLLYVFLQEKSAGNAFYSFCKTVGSDFIERKEFLFWFKQFKQGKFDDKEQPLPDIREIIRRDKHALRVCVLYEWMIMKKELVSMMERWYYQNKALPVFKKYQSYCKVLGDDVMNYPVFDFWFYRFVNGEYDLNYERDNDNKIYELTDLPLDIMRNILDYMRIFDRMSLAGTSRSLKEFIESQKSSYKKLDFLIDHKTAEVCFEHRSIVIEKREYGFYRKPEPECLRTIKKIDLLGFPYNKKLINGVPYWKRGVQELESILNLPKLHLEVFRFQHPRGFDAVDALEAVFKSIQHLHVKKLSFRSYSMKSLLNILPIFKPGYLTTIDFDVIDSKPCHLEELVEMEQFKQAKYLSTNESSFYGLQNHL